MRTELRKWYITEQIRGLYVFDPKCLTIEFLLFFSDSKVTSNSYAQSDNQQLYEVYLAIKKPYVIDAKGHMWNELDDKLEIQHVK